MKQPRRRGGGGVLHPPVAIFIARQLRDCGARAQSNRSGRQGHAIETFSPCLRIGLDAQIKRRLAHLRRDDALCDLRAITLSPALAPQVKDLVQVKIPKQQ